MISPARMFTTVRRAIRTIFTACPADRRAARQPPSPADWCRSRSARTPTARSACPPRSAACSGSSRPMAGSAAPALFRSRRASIMSARWRAAPATWRWPTTPCRATTRTIRFAPIALPDPLTPLLDRGIDGLRIAVAGGYFKCRTAESVYAVDRVAGGARRQSRHRYPGSGARAVGGLYHHRERGRQPASRPAASSRARFRSGRARPADRRRHAPGFAGREGAEIPPLVSAARCSNCSRTSTLFWRRRRRARRR